MVFNHLLLIFDCAARATSLTIPAVTVTPHGIISDVEINIHENVLTACSSLVLTFTLHYYSKLFGVICYNSSIPGKDEEAIFMR